MYLCSVFYRRKVILSLLQLFDGQLDKIRLQKLLFLFSQKQPKAEYDFIPYRFGCFSYSANADMKAMGSNGIIREDEKSFEKIDKTDYLKQLKPLDQKLLMEVKASYGKMSATALMKHTYINFPFYAINSETAESVLSKEELEKVIRARPQIGKSVLYTIGYEGISLEEYLVRLLKKDVKVLVDVRNNPLSMKYGFNKNQLSSYCRNLGIKYIHFPEVGIQSDQRQELITQADYDRLFTNYRERTLIKTAKAQGEILQLLMENERIALTCFEADICRCHRKHLADAIEALPGFVFKVEHI